MTSFKIKSKPQIIIYHHIVYSYTFSMKMLELTLFTLNLIFYISIKDLKEKKILYSSLYNTHHYFRSHCNRKKRETEKVVKQSESKKNHVSDKLEKQSSIQKCHSIHLVIVAIKPWTAMSSFAATSCFIQGNLKGLQN